MIQVTIQDSRLQNAAQNGMDNFVQVFIDAINESIGGQLTLENMPSLNSDQITLLAYSMLREEVMDGGFVQLIYNGLGQFIFFNPFEKAIAAWGLEDFARLIKKARRAYLKYRGEIECECSDDEFMAMFKRMPEFDDLDDDFVANEEQWTSQLAYYIDEHIDNFAAIAKD